MSDDGKPKRPPRRPPRPAVVAFLSRPDVVKWVLAHVKPKVPPDDVETVAQDALQRAVEKGAWPESDEEGLLWGTLRTVVDRQVADHLDKRATRREYEGPMPAQPLRQDEAGDYVPDEDRDADPSQDPQAGDARKEGMLVRRFLEQAVRGNARDEQTLGWMLEWAERDVDYRTIAEREGLAYGTVRARVHELREKYLPRYQKWRNQMVLLLLLGGVALALVVALLLWAWLHREPAPMDIAPEPPRPAPSADAAPSPLEPLPEPFNQAAPTDGGGLKPGTGRR